MGDFLKTFSLVFIFTISLSAYEFNMDFGDVDESAIPAALLKGANEAYDMNLQGLDELGAGNLDKAMELFVAASRKIPNYSDAENNRAVVYLRRGNIGSARDIWSKISKNDPEYATAWYNLGIVADMYGNIDEANGFFNMAIKKNSRFAEAYVMLGKMSIKNGEPKKGHKNFKKAFELTPNVEMIWGSYAYSLTTVGDTIGAEKILLSHSDHPEALKMLGEIAASQKRFDDAINYLSESASRGSDPSVLGAVARLKLDAGDPCGALIAAEEYLSSHKSPEADLYNLGGIAAKECGDLRKAALLFKEGARKYSGDAILKFNSGAILYREGKFKDAYDLLSTVSDTMNDPDLYKMRVLSLVKIGSEVKALEEVDIALRKFPTNSQFYDIKGSLLYKKGKVKEAEKSFALALKYDPANESARFNMTLCKGEGSSLTLKEVIKTFEKKLDNCTSDCQNRIHKLARLYSFNRENEKAVSLLKTSGSKNLDTYVLLSKFLNELGKNSEALEILEDASGKFKLNAVAKLELAGAYLASGVYTKAVGLLKQIESSNSVDHERVVYQLGYAYMKMSNYFSAAEAFERYNGTKKDVTGFLGFIYNELGETAKAEENWSKSLKEDAQNPMMWVNMGLLQFSKGQFKEAIVSYQKALELPNANSGILINMALAYESLNQFAKAEKHYKKAFGTSADKKARYNLALLYAAQKNIKKAETQSSYLNSKYPASIEAKRVAGEVALLKERYSEAEKIFTSISSKTVEDYSALARIYMSLGKESKMNSSLSHLPDEEEWNDLRKKLRSEIAFTSGNYEDAYKELKEKSDNTFMDRYNLALLAFKAGDYKSAYDSATTLMKSASGDDKFNLIKLAGNSSIQLSDWKNSDLWWSHYLELKPFESLAAYNVAVAAYNMDNIDRAMEYYKKAQSIDPTIKNPDIENKYKFVHKEPVKDSVIFEKLDEMYNSAVVLQNSGKANDAKKIYEEIIEEDGRYYRAWNNLGAIYGAEGELEKAIDCYKNAVSRRADIIDGYANLVNIYIAIEDISNAERWLKKGYKLEPENEILKQLEAALRGIKK